MVSGTDKARRKDSSLQRSWNQQLPAFQNGVRESWPRPLATLRWRASATLIKMIDYEIIEWDEIFGKAYYTFPYAHDELPWDVNWCRNGSFVCNLAFFMTFGWPLCKWGKDIWNINDTEKQIITHKLNAFVSQPCPWAKTIRPTPLSSAITTIYTCYAWECGRDVWWWSRERESWGWSWCPRLWPRRRSCLWWSRWLHLKTPRDDEALSSPNESASETGQSIRVSHLIEK